MPSTDRALLDQGRAEAHDVAVLALYLPQFHPVPENDAFWGPGFTEWTNTVAGRPRFSDHRQPRLPGELGMYDLRLVDTMAAQERLAAQHGIGAFVYYHYWFHGHRVLPTPLDAKLATPELDLPFALCWANHDWNRSQNGQPTELLIEQRYSDDDDRAHSAFIADAMTDPRYLRLDDRPVFVMYRTQEHPNPARFAQHLRDACRSRNVPDPYLIRFETNQSDNVDPAAHGFDAACDLHPHWLWYLPETHRPATLQMGMPLDFWTRYDEVAAASAARERPSWTRFPCVVPDWDTTSRRPNGGATALHGASAHGYETWLSREVCAQQQRPDGPRLVMINAWNEWSECGYLEPDAELERSLLEATARAAGTHAPLELDDPTDESELKMYDLVIDPNSMSEAYRAILELVPTTGTVLEVGCGAGHLTALLQARSNVVTAVDINPTAAARAARYAAQAFAHDLDRQVLSERLRGQQFDCILLADVLEHVRAPIRVLTDVLALLRPGGSVVISVPNIGHVDARLMLLQGRWDYQPSGLLDDTHLRFFTRRTLERMLRDAGLAADEWRASTREPFRTNLGVTHDEVPESVLHHLLQADDATTYQFIVRARPTNGAEHLAAPTTTRDSLHGLAAPGATSQELEDVRRELEAYRNLRVLRLTALPRRWYGWLRRALGRASN